MGRFLCSRHRGGFYLVEENKGLGESKQCSVCVCVECACFLVLPAACLFSVNFVPVSLPACVAVNVLLPVSLCLSVPVYTFEGKMVFTHLCLSLCTRVSLCLLVCVVCIYTCILRNDHIHVCLSLCACPRENTRLPVPLGRGGDGPEVPALWLSLWRCLDLWVHMAGR